MAFDLKQFLMTDLGLSDEDATATAAKIKGEKVQRLEANAKTLADIDSLQTKLEAANKALEGEMAEWASLTAKEKTAATEQAETLETARVRVAQLESRLTTLANEHGVDPKALLEGTVVVPAKKEEPPVPPIDPNLFVPNDRFVGALSYSIDLPASLDYIQREHFKLTGEYIDARELTKTIKANAGKKDGVVDPVQVWESQYGIPAKREAKAKADYDKDMAAAEARGEERARSAGALPNAQAPGRHAPIFGSRGPDGNVQPRTSALKRPQPGETVSRAAAALRSHKYRQPETTSGRT